MVALWSAGQIISINSTAEHLCECLAPPTCAPTCAYFMLMSRCIGSWGARRAARGWAGWSSAGSSGNPAGGFSPGDAVQTRLTADPRNTNGSLFKTELEKPFSLITFVFYPNLSRWVTSERETHTTLICCLYRRQVKCEVLNVAPFLVIRL